MNQVLKYCKIFDSKLNRGYSCRIYTVGSHDNIKHLSLKMKFEWNCEPH